MAKMTKEEVLAKIKEILGRRLNQEVGDDFTISPEAFHMLIPQLAFETNLPVFVDDVRKIKTPKDLIECVQFG